MKIMLKFNTLTPELPYDYRRAILSFLKKSLSNIADGKYFEEYYLVPKRRNFVFAVRFPKCNFSSGVITLSKKEITVLFSTGDSKTGFVFMSAFLAQKGQKQPLEKGNALILESVRQLSEKTVTSDLAMVSLKSPLCLRDHNGENQRDYYYSVNHQDFKIKAEEIISRQIELAGFDKNMANTFSIEPVNARKTVVTHYGCNIECSLGDFIIKGDKAVINYLLRYGIGSRKSAGFGFAELIAEGETEAENEI